MRARALLQGEFDTQSAPALPQNATSLRMPEAGIQREWSNPELGCVSSTFIVQLTLQSRALLYHLQHFSEDYSARHLSLYRLRDNEVCIYIMGLYQLYKYNSSTAHELKPPPCCEFCLALPGRKTNWWPIQAQRQASLKLKKPCKGLLSSTRLQDGKSSSAR